MASHFFIVLSYHLHDEKVDLDIVGKGLDRIRAKIYYLSHNICFTTG